MTPAQYAYHLNAHGTNPTMHAGGWTTSLPGVRDLLGLPEDTDLNDWIKQDGNPQRYNERQNLIRAMADQVLQDEHGHYGPRILTFALDDHAAYEEVAERYRATHCTDCDEYVVRPVSESHCPLCESDIPDYDWLEVDMASDAARHEIEFLQEVFADDYHMMLADYCNANAAHDAFYIEGHGLGWQHRTGTMDIRNTVDALADALALTCEHTNRCSWDRKTGILTVNRSHHDAPTGETLVVNPAYYCELDDSTLMLADHVNYASHANLLAPNPAYTYTRVSWEGLLHGIDLTHQDATLYGLAESVGPSMTLAAAGHLADLIDLLCEDNAL